MAIGYSAILLPELQQPNSRFKVDLEISSWIGRIKCFASAAVSFFNLRFTFFSFTASIVLLPMAFGCLLAGFLMDRCGRKLTILIVNVPFVVGWCVISMSNCMAVLLVGRAITGFCAGVFSPAGPLYISEITDPKYRGFFLASITFSVSLGIFATHLLAFYCTWHVNAIVCGVFPFIGYILTTFFCPETPSWLLSKNLIPEACDAFLWLRGCDDNANNEFRMMVDAHAKNDAAAAAIVTQNDDDNKRNEANANRFFYAVVRRIKLIAHKSFYAPLIILTIYFATLQFSGKKILIFEYLSLDWQYFSPYGFVFSFSFFLYLFRWLRCECGDFLYRHNIEGFIRR